MTDSERRGVIYAVTAVALFATSPVLIRLAAPLHPVHLTLARLVVASAAVLLAATVLGEVPWRERRRRRYAAYGLVTALHFALYIASLSYTTIAHSLALVYTAPIFVSLLAWLILREPLPRRRWPGVVIACAGIVVLTGFEPTLDGRMLLGDLLALGSAVCFALYSVAGRYELRRAPVLTYAGHVYGAAALWLVLPALLVGPPLLTWQIAAAALALGLGPLGLGHTLYNAALRRLHPTAVMLIAAQEVTGGIILGAVLLQELPGLHAMIGVLATLLGVLLVLI